MTAYYNENDPFAAQWLRNLIREGLIAPGEVDDRSIIDVRPGDLRGFIQCHFFAGLGGWSLALRLAGWPDSRPVWTGSCPCQPFSQAGRGGGFEDERHLWPKFYELVGELRPADVLGEQVASPDGLQWLDLVLSDMERAGYAGWAVDYCAAGLGAPHIRQRLWWGGKRIGCVADADSAESELPARAGAGPGEAAGAGAHGQPDGSGDAGLMEQPNGGPVPEPIRGAEGRTGAAATAGRLADGNGSAGGQGSAIGGRGDHRSDAVEGPGSRGDGGSGGMVDGLGAGLEGYREGSPAPGGYGTGEDGPVATTGGAGGMAGTDRDGLEAGGLPVRQGGEGRPSALQPGHGSNGGPGPVNGFWRDADWLLCRDGRWRPVEPGTFPLAHGVRGRVGQLRAYGNAIVPQVAAEIIAAYMECEG